jgi:hypothetical protein
MLEKEVNVTQTEEKDQNTESVDEENILESFVLLFGYWKSSWMHKFINLILENKVVRKTLNVLAPITVPVVMLMQYIFGVWLAMSLFILDTILHRILPVMERLVNLWLYFILLPYRVTKWMIHRAWRIFLLMLVFVLNRSPGGQKVLKALNGHIMKH